MSIDMLIHNLQMPHIGSKASPAFSAALARAVPAAAPVAAAAAAASAAWPAAPLASAPVGLVRQCCAAHQPWR